MSRARAKGTRGENYFLQRLRTLFGDQVERAPLKGTLDYGDFTGVPWLHEAKNTAKPLFLEWARKAASKAGSLPWVVMWKGDLRKDEGPYVLMPMWVYEELVDGFFNEALNRDAKGNPLPPRRVASVSTVVDL
jgi:hypothetical protein